VRWLREGPISTPTGRLFRGPPGYRAVSPWGPVAAIAVAAIVEGLSLLGTRFLADTAGTGDLPAMAISQALGVVLIVAASALLGGRPRDVLALHAPAGGWRSYAVAVLAMTLLRIVAGLLLYFAVTLSAGGLDPLADWQRDQGLLQSADVALLMVVLAVGAPLSEELIYRGFLLSALARTRLGFWGAALVVTAVWTALHDYSAFGVVGVFTMGLVLSWLLWRTGSLRVAIFCHALNNALVLVAHQLISLPVSP
jgi:uncharacterized protein